MQVYNADETGINVVYKPGRVVAMVGRKNVYSIAAGERGKKHTILACVSASGISLPPLMIYPRKRSVPEGMRAGAPPDTMFMVSDSGWMIKEIYLEWFKQFAPARPVLLIQDGHASHVSIDLARANDIHLLCLPPSHYTHTPTTGCGCIQVLQSSILTGMPQVCHAATGQSGYCRCSCVTGW